MSLLSVETRTAYPLITEQLVRGDVQKSAPKAVMPKKKPGRPKGSVNKNKKEVTLSPFQIQLQGCIRAALTLIGLDVDVMYFVYDGALGNNAGLQAIKQAGLHLICKLRCDSTLYFPYPGEYSGKGKPRKYGEKLTLETLTSEHLKEELIEKGIRTRVYQVQVEIRPERRRTPRYRASTFRGRTRRRPKPQSPSSCAWPIPGQAAPRRRIRWCRPA